MAQNNHNDESYLIRIAKTKQQYFKIKPSTGLEMNWQAVLYSTVQVLCVPNA